MPFFSFDDVFCFPNGFVDKLAAVPNFNLVNQLSLDKILKAKVFIHSDDQLRAATTLSHPIFKRRFRQSV